MQCKWEATADAFLFVPDLISDNYLQTIIRAAMIQIGAAFLFKILGTRLNLKLVKASDSECGIVVLNYQNA